MTEVVHSALSALYAAAVILAVSAAVFGLLALAVKGREALGAARRAAHETRTNVAFHFIDAVLIGPVIAIVVQTLLKLVDGSGLALLQERHWSAIGPGATLIGVFLLGDLIGYWRHRAEHTRLLWPAHAIHHSDTQMTWLTIARFHPINRLTTSVVDLCALALLGAPAWAILAYVLVRHYYGAFIHADLPWTYGAFGKVVVSPVMHRWHHARDVTGSGSNFATLFSFWDRLFGTYFVPGPCTVPLGVNDEVGASVSRQLLHPFVAWARPLRRALVGQTPNT